MNDRSKSQVAADAWGSLLRIHADLVPLMDLDLKATGGLPLSWYDILLELNFADDHALTMGELSAKVVLSRTRVSRLVDEMASAGLVAKRQHPDDKRSAFAVLTDEGLRRFRAAAPVYLAAIDTHFGTALSKRELELMTGLLEKIVARRRQSMAQG